MDIIIKETDQNINTIIVSGKLNTNTCNELQDVLERSTAKYKKTILDLKELIYVSSAGLRVLLIGEKSSKAVGNHMILCNICQEVMEVLEMTGFTNILQIE